MSNRHQEFGCLMERVAAGSEEAVRELLDEYGSAVYRVIRRRLKRELRSQYDSQDFYQAVWASFFANREVLVRFHRPEDLVAFLGSVAGNKVVEQCRRRLVMQKSNLNRERPLDEALADSLSASDPTPSELIGAREQLDRLTKGYPPHYRQIVESRASGATFEQIAAELGMHERSVRRIITLLSRRFVS